MSGGSMNYLYSKLEYAEFDTDTPQRKAFAEHLKLVAKALHDIEWVDSCDYGPGDENAAIEACLHSAGVNACLAILSKLHESAKDSHNYYGHAALEIERHVMVEK